MRLKLNNGLLRIADGDIGAQYSANVRISLDSDLAVKGYVPSLLVKFQDADGEVVEGICPVIDGEFAIPGNAYTTTQVIMLTVSNVKGDETINSQPLYVRINAGNSGGTEILPSDEDTWKTAVKAYVDGLLAATNEKISQLEKKIGTGGGISETAKTLLCDILSDAIYGSSATFAKVEQLREALGAEGGSDTPVTPPEDEPTVTEYNVTWNLTGYTADSMPTKVTEFLSVNLSKEEGYEDGDITVTMGGVDITESVVNGDFILIQNVTGDIVVTATALQLTTATMTTNNLRATALDIYPNGYGDGGETRINLAFYYWSEDVYPAGASVSVTFKNDSASPVSLARCHYGYFENPYIGNNKDLINLCGAKPYSGSIPANGELNLTYTMPASGHVGIVMDNNASINNAVGLSVKVSNVGHSATEGWNAVEIKSFNSGSVNWYAGETDTSEQIYTGWSVCEYIGENLPSGRYQVGICADAGDTGLISYVGLYDGANKGKAYNTYKFTNPVVIPSMMTATTFIDVPQGYSIIARRKDGSVAFRNVWLRKVG